MGVPAAAPGAQTSNPSGPITVLAVDDEPDILLAIGWLLKEVLPEVRYLTATSAAAAQELLAKETVDVLVTDYRMPRESGLDLLRHAMTVAPNMGRILLTAYPDMELAIRALNEARIDRFLTKPLNGEALAEAVRSVVTERRAQLV